MVADQDFPSEHDQDYALALIQGRIAEKRLFEARFLCRRLGDGLGVVRRQALARELDEALAQVEPLRRQAQALVAQGDHYQAGLVYSQIEAIAVDVPGVAEERQALAGAEALAARLHKPPVAEPETLVEVVPAATMAKDREIVAPDAVQIESSAAPPAAPLSTPQGQGRSSFPGWKLLASGGLVAGALVFGFLLWNKPATPPPPAAASTIIIQPLQPVEMAVSPDTPSPPASEPPPVVAEPATPAPSVPVPDASTPALHLGSLQIKPVKKNQR